MFGAPITNIKRDNLINKTNSKNMLVTIEFERDGNHYKIERGRKPGLLKFLTNNKEFEADDDGIDEAHGESRVTQQEIERILGFSKELFRHIVALNTFTEPFLAQGAGPQRTIIEELLGVTQLSRKAELLKEQSKQTKDKITEEEYRIKAVIESNNKIQTNIDTLKMRSVAWRSSHEKRVCALRSEILELQKINIENEIEFIKANAIYRELENAHKQLKKDKQIEAASLERVTKRLNNLAIKYNSVTDSKCPTCGSELHDESHQRIISELELEIQTENELSIKSKTNIDTLVNEIVEIEQALHDLKLNKTHYDDLNEAYLHRSNLDKLVHELELEQSSNNPYEEQIAQLETSGITEISYEHLNALVRRREHQEFLWKLLTNKDSFIRKKIIDQNLSYLNHRLNHYLERLGLPHEVKFLNDLSVEISELGRDYDFDNLSRGEKNRLILGLSFAFRDIWESLNVPINLLFIDELIDSGLDQIGVESSLTVLKSMGRDRGKDIFLISHREELLSRVSKVMLVRKENGFTSFSEDVEDVSKLEV
ncbi:MAG: hypothetical protein HC836_10715 [Richelia sp. RM2_1_2]|nr:hypothetical protein [Richelia sp. RM2_1_2]